MAERNVYERLFYFFSMKHLINLTSVQVPFCDERANTVQAYHFGHHVPHAASRKTICANL